MKRCARCKRLKEFGEFYKAGERYLAYCKPCHANRRREQVAKLKEARRLAGLPEKLKAGRKPTPIQDRFNAAWKEDPNSGCWIWQKCIDSNGYGVSWWNGKKISAHRVAYILYRGPIHEGLEIDHLCRCRSCVNPQHLEAVPPPVNTERGLLILARGANNRRKTHCPSGHPYIEGNLYFSRTGARMCKTCHLERANKQHTKSRKTTLQD